jgi:uncharacterized protein YpmS
MWEKFNKAFLICLCFLTLLTIVIFVFALISYRVTDWQYEKARMRSPKSLVEFERIVFFRKREVVPKSASAWHSCVKKDQIVYRYFITVNDCIDVVTDDEVVVAIIPVYE